MTYNASTNVLVVTPNLNTYAGTHVLNLVSTLDSDSSRFDNEYFAIEIEKNYPPVYATINASDLDVTIRNDEFREWTFTVDSDDNNDTAWFDLDLFDSKGNLIAGPLSSKGITTIASAT